MKLTKPIAYRIYSILGFAFLFAYLLSFLFEGQVFQCRKSHIFLWLQIGRLSFLFPPVNIDTMGRTPKGIKMASDPINGTIFDLNPNTQDRIKANAKPVIMLAKAPWRLAFFQKRP